jgi:ligand-binding SRPBCC domain-containing protein
MPIIHLETVVDAPRELVFDLARSIDLHQQSLSHTDERAVAGRLTGLVEQGETVTWQARHLGFKQLLTSKITQVQPHDFFADEMVSGAFKRFRHEHRFEQLDNSHTLMIDVFDYDSPLGFIGKLVDRIFLKSYMKRLLTHRNHALKNTAENGRWQQLPGMRDNYSK